MAKQHLELAAATDVHARSLAGRCGPVAQVRLPQCRPPFRRRLRYVRPVDDVRDGDDELGIGHVLGQIPGGAGVERAARRTDRPSAC